MATTDLGRLEPVDLREVWPNEESDFTPWLADQKNLAILGDALGMPLEFVAREEAVGPYSADILCRDSNDGTQVVVENQLESTDHDHLGKLLTYAAHLGARVVVWIAKSFTDQHRAALDWLNEVSETGAQAAELVGNQRGVGRAGFYLYGVVSTWSEGGGHELRAELVITGQDANHYFDLLHADRHVVEEEHEFGDEMEWYNPTGVQQRKIYWRLLTDFGDRDLRTDQYRWLLERVEALHRILAPRVKALPVPE